MRELSKIVSDDFSDLILWLKVHLRRENRMFAVILRAKSN